MGDQSKIKVGQASAMEGEKVNGGLQVIKKFKNLIFILRHVSLIIEYLLWTKVHRSECRTLFIVHV